MSVVVIGMEMPSGCQSCDFSDDEARFCKAAKEYIPMLGKPEFCPLVELPARHGRLIDEGALRDIFGMGYSCEDCKQNVWDCSYNQNYTRMDFCGWLDEMETIVEAEGD